MSPIALLDHLGWTPRHAATQPWAHRHATPPWTLRTACRGDAAALRDFVDALSPASRRLRFHAAVHCTDAWAERLATSDGQRQFVVVAVEPDTGTLIGETRWARAGVDSTQAELAIAVADAWQGRGVADALIARILAHAQAAGLLHLVAHVLHDNERVQSFLDRHGFSIAGCTDDGLRMVLALDHGALPAWARRAAALGELLGVHVG